MDLQAKLLHSFEGEDELGVVVRAHIIIEQYINHLLDGLVVNSDYLHKMNLDYAQSVQLAISLGLDPKFHSSLSALGKIRNDFAHKLIPSISKQAVNNLYSSLDPDTKAILNNGIKSLASDTGNKKQKDFDAKQQFVNIVCVLGAALQTACNQSGTVT